MWQSRVQCQMYTDYMANWLQCTRPSATWCTAYYPLGVSRHILHTNFELWGRCVEATETRASSSTFPVRHRLKTILFVLFIVQSLSRLIKKKNHDKIPIYFAPTEPYFSAKSHICFYSIVACACRSLLHRISIHQVSNPQRPMFIDFWNCFYRALSCWTTSTSVWLDVVFSSNCSASYPTSTNCKSFLRDGWQRPLAR